MKSFATDASGTGPVVYARALASRDPRFDGVFFVGIITTRVYCRPVCPARVSYPDHRRFFASAAQAERAGFRPCLRCRPELAPGRSSVDAVSRIARSAAQRIAAGALNGRTVSDLARDLGVSARHLRRALDREIGVSPVELAQTHRLLLAKRLLVDTDLPVTRIAFASGFQSLRRFNTTFRAQYRMAPSAIRGTRRAASAARAQAGEDPMLRFCLAYRPPLAWTALLQDLRRTALPGVEAVCGESYERSVRIGEHTGRVVVSGPPAAKVRRMPGAQLEVDVTASLLPVLMPLIATLRRMFDLDAEPQVVDRHLARGMLRRRVSRTPGLRMCGAFDGLEAALGVYLRNEDPAACARLLALIAQPLAASRGSLSLEAPEAGRLSDLGAAGIAAEGVAPQRATGLAAMARALADGSLRLDAGADFDVARGRLAEIPGMQARDAVDIAARALHWPDAFEARDEELLQSSGLSNAAELASAAESWRPWRGYAAAHLRLAGAGIET